MKNSATLSIFFIALLIVQSSEGQPAIEWKKSFGGPSLDACYNVWQTSDGGYIACGATASTGGNVTVNHGLSDFWVLKLGADGSLVWEKSFGATDYDYGRAVQEIDGGNFIVAGSKGAPGGSDYAILKLNGNGDSLWEHTLGGSLGDTLYAMQQTTDGGFIVAGTSASSDSDVTTNNGLTDYWIVKLDADGNIVWQKSLGGPGKEECYSIQQIADGGYVAAGYSYGGGTVTGNHGLSDCWIVKLDANGTLLWQKSLGGEGDEGANCIRQTPDGGFIVVGYSNSSTGDVSVNFGGNDLWLVKLDATGNKQWDKSYGGTGEDVGNYVQQTTNGDFIMVGKSDSNNGDAPGNFGHNDFWIVKIDTSGTILWKECHGGTKDDIGFSIQQTNDDGYIVGGWSASNDGDIVASEVQGSRDYWIIKLATDIESGVGSLAWASVSISPNPANNFLNIDLRSQVNQETIAVYDVHGKYIVVPTSFYDNTIQLNTTSLAEGFYVLKVVNKSSGEMRVERFIKTK